MSSIIETKGITKLYGKTRAVDEVSINVNQGDIYGLIGKNGAGKTTLMKLLLGLAVPKSGTVKLFGGADLSRSRKRIGSLVEAPALYKNETAFENMKRFSYFAPATDDEIKSILTFVGLGNTGWKRAGQFSLGMKQRLGIAIALLGRPDVLILDEPVNGLDPAGIKEIRDVILELNSKGVTFLISSHLLDELGKIATRYGIMANGRLVEEISAAQVEEECRGCLKVVTDDSFKAFNTLAAWRRDIKAEVYGNELQIKSPVEDSSVVASLLVNAGVRVYELKAENVGLENFFIERLGR